IQVDAHNIVPIWTTSEKVEYAARTIRPKIQRNLPEFLTEFPPLIKHPHSHSEKSKPIDWKKLESSLEVDRTVLPVVWATPGTKAGLKELEQFCVQRLKIFGSQRNDPNKKALSNLSPWLHFGHISAQRCILEASKHRNSSNKESVDAFIEEAVVRRELSDNYCYYNKNYDNVKGAYEWAQNTLKVHANDKREYLYTLKQFDNGVTHDNLWNAAQMQLIHEGKIHGFLRMYWAKRIFEWTESPDEALRISIFLNDKYSLDGRDPNGYAGQFFFYNFSSSCAILCLVSQNDSQNNL
ncbi:UNVERIFIED_CONTAM: hypothetical protein GTU68_016245, partial [Idotea baltica]|nr:hypothetical protein [Idotea baltica]